MKKKVAIITTHPIQYNAPFFRIMAMDSSLEIKVFYTWSQSIKGENYDPDFKLNVKWDLPLLEGYEFEFVNNISSNPGSHHFWGIVNPTLNSTILKFNPDALIIYGWKFYSHLMTMIYFKNKKKIYFRGDSNLIDRQSWYKEMIRKLILKWIYKNIDYAIYTGIANYRYYLINGINAENLIWGPHAIEMERFKNCEKLQIEAKLKRLNLGFSNSDIVLLFAGKFEKKKDPLILIDLIKALNLPYLKLIFVGDGELKGDLLLSSKNIESIKFLEFQNQTEMPKVYTMANLLILPSKGPDETWGLVVNEAMTCGLPIIVSDKVGCAQDLIQNGINGFTFEAGNILDLKRVVLEILNNCNLKVMGKNSIELIKKWNYENMLINFKSHFVQNIFN